MKNKTKKKIVDWVKSILNYKDTEQVLPTRLKSSNHNIQTLHVAGRFDGKEPDRLIKREMTKKLAIELYKSEYMKIKERNLRSGHVEMFGYLTVIIE